jgi:hypothetical protein
MRDYSCYIYHLKNGKLINNPIEACWAGLIKSRMSELDIDVKTKKDIYIDKYIQPKITDIQRKRIVYLVNKITLCKFVLIEDKIYIKYKLLDNHYSNLLLLNFIRILWYKNGSFNNENFFTDICKPKTRGLDYLEFMMTCVKNNVLTGNSWNYGSHSFVYPDIVPKTKEMLLKYKGVVMQSFLQSKIEDIN